MPTAETPSIIHASENYEYGREIIFRRELESYLLRAISYALAISNGSDTQTSLTHKRHQYLPPLGSVSVP